MNYDQAISYLLTFLKIDEPGLRNMAKKVLYENELPINDKTIDTVIIVTAEYYKGYLMYLN